ncbi:unnamed protein product [Effrenium voratum]|nr:unnamed protein product [Effrenium voratum]
MYCTGADRVLMDPVIMTHGAQGHYYCKLRLPEGRTSVTLSFVLNKNTSGLLSRGVDYVRDYLPDLFAAKPTEGLLHARLDLSLQPDSIEPVFHELQLEKGKNIPQEELFDRFVCAFHEEVCPLGAEMEAALMRSIQHFSQLYNQLRRAPKLDRYLKVLEQPCFASQGAFAAYVLGRLGTTPLPGGLVLVEQRNSGKKDATNRMLREVVQVEGKDLLVRPLIVFKGKAERVQRQAAELIAIELSGAEKVLESLRCSSDSLEFALLRDDEVAQHGLHRLMVSDAKKGGEQWINFTRFLVTLEAEVGKLGLHTILQPVSFCRAGHRDAEIRASLQDMRPCIDEMTPETREAFFKALLGERFCIMDLVWVLSACEAPPQRSTLQAVSSLIGLGSAAANDDGEALVHKILGSLACTHYIQQMKLCPANLGDVGRAFAGASGFVRGQLPHLMEELLTRAIRGAWPNLEDAMAGFAQLLDAAGDTEELKRCVQLLWQVCAATPKGQPELCQRVLRHLAGYMHFLEASAVFSQYIALRMESAKSAPFSIQGSTRWKKDAEKVLLALAAGTELLSAGKWEIVRQEPQMITRQVKRACEAYQGLALLHALEGLRALIGEEMCTVLVTMIEERAPMVVSDPKAFVEAAEVSVAVLQAKGARQRHVEDAVVALLDAATQKVDLQMLVDDDAASWRLFLRAWSSLGGKLQAQSHLHDAATLIRHTLKQIHEGSITLQSAEDLLKYPKSTLLDLLEIFAQELFWTTVDNEWARSAVVSLEQDVSKYTQAAARARGFLALCRRVRLWDAEAVNSLGSAVLQLDRERPVRELKDVQGRWWFCAHPAAQNLPDCGMFLRAACEWAERSEHCRGDDDSDQDDLPGESDGLHDLQQLEAELGIHGNGDCAALMLDVEGLFETFKSLCEQIVQTPTTSLSYQAVKSVLPLDEAESIGEHLRQASGVSKIDFPDSLVEILERTARLSRAAKDVRAVFMAADVCGFEPLSGNALAMRLGSLSKTTEQLPALSIEAVSSQMCSDYFRPLTVQQVADAVRQADDEVLSPLQKCGNLKLVRALAEAAELYDFVKPLLSEDLMPLHDSVETHSDELLRADTVFALLDVQSFFRALRRAGTRRGFVAALNSCITELTDVKDIAGKLATCTQHCHGLENLYRNLAKREEVASEKIRAAVKQGVFAVTCQGGATNALLSYRREGSSSMTLSRQELVDLRSRALLSGQDLEIMAAFVQQVDVLLVACGRLDTLCQEGFIWARDVRHEAANPNSLQKLQALEAQFQADLEEWRLRLQEARANYVELTFLYSQQFWLLADFLAHTVMDDSDLDMVMSILGYIQGRALSAAQRAAALRRPRVPWAPRNEMRRWFQQLGQGLGEVLALVTGKRGNFIPTAKSLALDRIEIGLRSVVKPGVVRTVQADRQEDVLRLALSFYAGVGSLPRAHEMLFCSGITTWPQLDAFLERCRHVAGMYCILHVERLTYSLQHLLVQRIKSGLGPSFQLVLVAVSEELSQVHAMRELPPQPAHALSPEGLKDFVRHLVPNLVCVVSEDAGCGKSETIRQRAFAQRKLPITVPLSGPLRLGSFIRRLLAQKWHAHSCLHLDIGPTDELDLLNDLLIQISFWGCVQAESDIAVVPCSFTFVELANLSTPVLRKLAFCNLVSPKAVRFSLDSFQVCRAPRSPAQVVCRVLDALHDRRLDSQPLRLEDPVSLPATRCLDLLQEYIVRRLQGPSYALVHTVLRVLAPQLVSFGHSAYFDPKTLKQLQLPASLRTQLVEQLIEACISFTTRAVTAGKLRQRRQHADQPPGAAEAFQGMVRWSETKPLLLFNRFDRQTLSLVYRKERLGRMILPLGKELGKPAEGSSYVVSPDNFVKMVWIALRVESRVPVIIMGETGCGKTSLIRHLAKLLSVKFNCLNVHAGTSAEDIINFVQRCAGESRQAQTWAFLDEVNTCEHMGLVTEIMCHHRLLGSPLPDSLVLLAACNPYRKKPQLSREMAAAQAELVLSDTSRKRKMSSLVYSVQELPETMYDYLYDFGFLGEKEEESYVKAMVQPVFNPNLVTDEQEFSRGTQLTQEGRTLRAVLNALAVSYHCRLPTRPIRNEYREQIARILTKHRKELPREFFQRGWDDGNIINWLVRDEMYQYLRHMTTPEMTAFNDALLENVFAHASVMMVCILNRIPVFVVGKPGNSKSLALRIIHANLRGSDSQQELWRHYPRIYVISYQGSDVSTSEGVTKVFEKAEQYKKSQFAQGSSGQVLVHFDEIGLAEASPNNPLKVLHAYLEPGYPKDRPDYAVVGLSNFPLDAAKMNRGIALVRPPPSRSDLEKTLKAICRLAQQEQPTPDFHGLRDFYYLAKTLAVKWPREESRRLYAIFRAVCRNFGGLPFDITRNPTGRSFYGGSSDALASVVDMLEENLQDKQSARHLLLVCEGEVQVALELIRQAADLYSFGLLKRIVLSMERGDILVMRALDTIHGSLYDMLNMSYTSLDNKKLCRIALGDKDILAEVNENFRCVVLQDAAELQTTDAAFLNRFEKHCVGINDLVTDPVQRRAVQELERLAGVAARPPESSGNASHEVRKLFVGWGLETAASLVNHVAQRGGRQLLPARLVSEAWRELAAVASLDGMLRATELSLWAHEVKEEAKEWREHFFAQPQSLQDWLLSNGWQNAPEGAAVRFALVLTTSPLQVDLGPVLGGVPAFRCLAVDALTSELDLIQKLEEFNEAPLPAGSVLVLQLRADSPHTELLRHRAAGLRADRRALLLLHGSRHLLASSKLRLRLNFQSGWAQVFLEQLTKDSRLNVRKCVESSLENLLKEKENFSLSHVVAAAALRLAAVRAASLIEDGGEWDELDGVLSAVCRPGEPGGEGAVLPSLMRAAVLREVHRRVGDEEQVAESCRHIPWLAGVLPIPGAAPLLAGAVPLFLGGFAPEAVEAAQVISTAALQQMDTPQLRELAEAASASASASIWRFAFFAGSSSLLCHTEARAEQREAARLWLLKHPQLQKLPGLCRGNREILPAEMQHRLQVSPLPLLTALHLAAALLDAPTSGFSAPFKEVAAGKMEGFLPAMPEDEEQVILKALMDGYSDAHYRGHTRYQCPCGYRYIVADCGHAVQESSCPQCHKTIGGTEFATRNNKRLDKLAQQGQVHGEAGYITHAASRDRQQSVRLLAPLPFRALHFLLHSALLGSLFRGAASLSLSRILEHLEADWHVLHTALNCAPAGFFMDIASRLLFPHDAAGGAVSAGCLTGAQRGPWELRMAQVVVEPCLDRAQRADFDSQLNWAASLGDVQALPLLLSDHVAPPGAQPARPWQAEGPAPDVQDFELLAARRALELGAGDLSFAKCLARRGLEVTATVLEAFPVVRSRYTDAVDRNRSELEQAGGRMLDYIDGTALQSSRLAGEQFDAVIYNFPYAGTYLDNVGKLPAESRLSLHTALLEGVFKSTRSVLTGDGSIWIGLLSSQFKEWRVDQLAQRQGLFLVEAIPFPRRSFPDYSPVWGDDRDFERSQPWQIYAGKPAVLCRFMTTPNRARQMERAKPPPAEDSSNEVPLALCRWMRLVEMPSLSRLELQFQSKSALAEKFQLLHAVLNARGLQLVGCLASVMEWLRFVRRHFEFQLSRGQASATRIREALADVSVREVDGRSGRCGSDGRRLFEAFQRAWALCAAEGFLARRDCAELPVLREVTLESPLALSCPDRTQEGSYVHALVNSLVDRQNEFLKQALEIAGQNGPSAWRVRSACEYWFHKGQVSLPSVGVEDIQSHHLVQAEDLTWLAHFGSAGALAGWEAQRSEGPELLTPGSACIFDWALMEQRVAERLLQKAVLLEPVLQPFPFRGEAFVNDYCFLAAACDQVPQQPCPAAARRFLLQAAKPEELMAFLQAGISVLRRLAPAPGLGLADFCRRWLKASPLQGLVSQPPCRELQVQHLVHLFEVVELQAAEEVLDSMPDRYQEEVDEKVFPCLKKWRGASAQLAHDVLLRLVIRLLHSGHGLETTERVSDWAATALAHDVQETEEGLFDDLQLKHIGQAIRFAKDCVQTEPSGGQASAMATTT